MSEETKSQPPYPTSAGAPEPCGVCLYHWNLTVMPGQTHNPNCPNYKSQPPSPVEQGPELLPCPFCGGSASLTNVRMSGHTFRVGCYNKACGVRPATDYYGSREQPSTEQEVVEAWNTRLAQPSLSDEAAVEMA